MVWKILWALSLRGRRSRNKVSVGEPVEGSFACFVYANMISVNLLCFFCPAGVWGFPVAPQWDAFAYSFYLLQACQYIQLWMPLLKHWWRMPWIVINIVTCRIPWINWILNMDCAAGVAFASIPSAYTHYCALWLCEWQSSADGASDKLPWCSYAGPITKGLCVFAGAFCAGWAKAMVLSYSNYDVDERTHWI